MIGTCTVCKRRENLPYRHRGSPVCPLCFIDHHELARFDFSERVTAWCLAAAFLAATVALLFRLKGHP